MDQKILLFLSKLIEFSYNPSYISDKAQLSLKIYQFLTPGWFRFGAIETQTEDYLKKMITAFVQDNKPIRILNACGGFKNYRIDTAPHIDMAEIFHLSFISNALVKICEIYEPGVELEYSGDSHMACIVDNIKKEWVDTYLKEFNFAIDYFDNITPKNLKITYKHFQDFYDYEELKKKVNELGDKEDLLEPKNSQSIEKYYQRALQNFCFDGEENLTSLSDNEKEEIVKRSILKTYIWYDLDFEKRGDYFGSFISICNLNGFPGAYCVRSIRHLPCPPFWQGKGVIEIVDGEPHAVILHNKMYLEESNGLTTLDLAPPQIKNLLPVGEVIYLKQ